MFVSASRLRSQDRCLKPLGHLSASKPLAGFTQGILPFALRAIGLADVRSGILPSQSRPVLKPLGHLSASKPLAGFTQGILPFALRAIGCADVRSGILSSQSRPVP